MQGPASVLSDMNTKFLAFTRGDLAGGRKPENTARLKTAKLAQPKQVTIRVQTWNDIRD